MLDGIDRAHISESSRLTEQWHWLTRILYGTILGFLGTVCLLYVVSDEFMVSFHRLLESWTLSSTNHIHGGPFS